VVVVLAAQIAVLAELAAHRPLVMLVCQQMAETVAGFLMPVLIVVTAGLAVQQAAATTQTSQAGTAAKASSEHMVVLVALAQMVALAEAVVAMAM
jgi:hypothetical protein